MELSESALRDCSLCDLLLCHLMNRFLERKESECDLELPSKRRKKLYSLQSVLDAKSSFYALKEYLYRIRLAMRYNQYWVVVPYQDLFQ